MRSESLSQVRRVYRELREACLDSLCPRHCPACGQVRTTAGSPLCELCSDGLVHRPQSGCVRCGEPLLGPACRQDHGFLRGIAGSVAAFDYQGSGGDLVRRLKFGGDRAGASYLATHMAERLRVFVRGAGRRAGLVSVPLHRRKLRRRGFDQAAVLAELVADELGLVYLPRVLLRSVDTLPQGDPRVMSREGNLAGVFELRRPRVVAGKRVVLVDDVITSGATARACAAVLRIAGVREVRLLTAARARSRDSRPVGS